jgi:hypothetical protein
VQQLSSRKISKQYRTFILQVRHNDTKQVEAVIPALQQGSVDAEGVLSSHNYVQLLRLMQLGVEHLWQMRESHAKLYPAYKAAGEAADK